MNSFDVLQMLLICERRFAGNKKSICSRQIMSIVKFYFDYWKKKIFKGNGNSIWALGISANGKTIVSGDMAGNVRLWNILSWVPGKELELRGHTKEINHVAISPDGSTVITGSNDGTVIIWDGKTGALKKKFNPSSYNVNLVNISADATTVAYMTQWRTIGAWKLEKYARMTKVGPAIFGNNHPTAIALSASGNALFVGFSHGEVRVWNWSDDVVNPIFEYVLGDRVEALAICGSKQLAITAPFDNKMAIWTLDPRRRGPDLVGHTGVIIKIAISADAATVVSFAQDRMIKTWDVTSGKCKFTLNRQAQWTRSVAISGDGNIIVSAGMDQIITAWNLKNLK